MERKTPVLSAVNKLSTEQRIELAEQKVKRLVEHTENLIAIHEGNRIIIYSSELSAQIPQSYAANAYNILQDSLFGFELIRLCVLWDEPRKGEADKESIPSVLRLIQNDCVMQMLREKANSDYGAFNKEQLGGQDVSDDMMEAIKNSHVERRKEYAARQCFQLQRTIHFEKLIRKSKKLESVRNYRNKYLAHSLNVTDREQKQGIIKLPQYGDERKLLRVTQRIVSRLYGGVNRIGYSFDDSYEFARKCSGELWRNCKFSLADDLTRVASS